MLSRILHQNMKWFYYPPAYLLAKLYLRKWKKHHKQRHCLSQEAFLRVKRAIKKHLLSPRRKVFHQQMLAAYFVHPGDMVIDVGAHVGAYAKYYSALVGKNGLVYAYEAHPRVFEELSGRLQGYKNVFCHNFAISKQSDERMKMRIYPEIDHESATVEESLMTSERMPGKTILIEVTTKSLDSCFLEKSSRCSFMKIDVEGHEHAVIEGAGKLIQRDKPVILYEYGSMSIAPKTISQLENLGYISYDCATLQPVEQGYAARESTDLIALPKERKEEGVITFLKDVSLI